MDSPSVFSIFLNCSFLLSGLIPMLPSSTALLCLLVIGLCSQYGEAIKCYEAKIFHGYSTTITPNEKIESCGADKPYCLITLETTKNGELYNHWYTCGKGEEYKAASIQNEIKNISPDEMCAPYRCNNGGKCVFCICKQDLCNKYGDTPLYNVMKILVKQKTGKEISQWATVNDPPPTTTIKTTTLSTTTPKPTEPPTTQAPPTTTEAPPTTTEAPPTTPSEAPTTEATTEAEVVVPGEPHEGNGVNTGTDVNPPHEETNEDHVDTQVTQESVEPVGTPEELTTTEEQTLPTPEVEPSTEPVHNEETERTVTESSVHAVTEPAVTDDAALGAHESSALSSSDNSKGHNGTQQGKVSIWIELGIILGAIVLVAVAFKACLVLHEKEKNQRTQKATTPKSKSKSKSATKIDSKNNTAEEKTNPPTSDAAASTTPVEQPTQQTTK